MTTIQKLPTAVINSLTEQQIKDMGTDKATLLANAADAPAAAKPSLWQASKNYVYGGAIFGVGVGTGVAAKSVWDSRKASKQAQLTN